MRADYLQEILRGTRQLTKMEGRSISATLRKYYVKLFVDPPGVRDGMVTSILDGYRYRTLRRPQRKGIKNKKSLPSRGKLKLKEVIFFFIFCSFAQLLLHSTVN
jgi:hypothetical protein